MKKFTAMILTVAMLLSLSAAFAEACDYCGGGGYVAMKVSGSDEYVAVACPVCSAGAAGTSSETPAAETPVEAPAESAPYTDHFPGYTELKPGETVKIEGLGKLTINELHLNERLLTKNFSEFYSYNTDNGVHTWLEASFLNTTAGSLRYRFDIFSDVTLYYINEDGTYPYLAWSTGRLYDDGSYFYADVDDDYIKYEFTTESNIDFSLGMDTAPQSIYTSSPNINYTYAACPSLEQENFIVAFKVPDAVIEDTEGIVAVTLTVRETGEKFVFYGRR